MVNDRVFHVKHNRLSNVYSTANGAGLSRDGRAVYTRLRVSLPPCREVGR
jgi:hypothetical protein